MPKQIVFSLVLLLLACTLPGCTRTTQRQAPATISQLGAPPAFVTLPPEQAIPQIIAAERDASLRGDLPLLAQMWAEDARIVDSRGTDDPADDFLWPNRAAILDRYTLAVFPAPPPPLDGAPTPTITVQGEAAEAINGQDRWQFTNQDGRWWIAELQY